MASGTGTNWVKTVLRTVDDKDAEGFCRFLAPDAEFVVGNAPATKGTAAIRAAVAGFFSTIDALRHTVDDVWSTDGTILSRRRVTYTRRDGTSLTVPFAIIIQMRGALASHYQIYVDASRL